MPELALAPKRSAILAPVTRPTPCPVPTSVGRSMHKGPRAYRGTGELWDYKDRYIGWLKATGLSPMTIKAAHADLSWCFRWLETQAISRAADVTPDVLEHYSYSLRQLRNGLPPSMGHVSRRLSSLKGFFRWLGKEAVIIYDPAEDLELPRLPQQLPHVILTQKETRKLLDAPELRSPVGYRDKAMLELIYGSGLRTAEIIALKVADIEIKSNIVHVRKGKGRKDRDVPVPPLTTLWVKEYIDKVRPAFAARRRREDGTLWLNYTGGVVDKNRMIELFRYNRKRAGLDKHVTPLTLRHSIASHLLENGMDIRCIQEILGHERLSTTQVYSKVTLTGLDKHFRRAHPRERDWAKAKK